MIATTALFLTLAAPAWAAEIRLERVELLSDETGRWLHHDLPLLGVKPMITGVRLLEQVQLSWALAGDSLVLGTGIESQSLTWQKNFGAQLAGGRLGAYGGVQSRLLLPRGVLAGLDWRRERLRIAAGLSAFAHPTWVRPSWSTWSALPVLSVAILTGKSSSEPRFRSPPEDRSHMRTDTVAPPPPAGEGGEPAGTQDGQPAAAGAPPSGSTAPEGARVLATPTEGSAAETSGTTPAAGTPPPPGEAPPAPTPPAAVEVTAPTGPTAVEFLSPSRVLLPSDAPTQVIIGGGEEPKTDEKKDESSQPKDKK